jgi:hypothetical protein
MVFNLTAVVVQVNAHRSPCELSIDQPVGILHLPDLHHLWALVVCPPIVDIGMRGGGHSCGACSLRSQKYRVPQFPRALQFPGLHGSLRFGHRMSSSVNRGVH